MRDYSDDPPEVDPDYGVFADPGSARIPARGWTAEDERAARYWRRKREREHRASADFNSHMIALFNTARKDRP